MKHEIYILNEQKFVASKFPGNKYAAKKKTYTTTVIKQKKEKN